MGLSEDAKSSVSVMGYLEDGNSISKDLMKRRQSDLTLHP
jgi:hypothetical protein